MNFAALKNYLGYLFNNIFSVLVVGIPLVYFYINRSNGDYVKLNNYKEISKLFVFLFFLSPELILPKALNRDQNITGFIFIIFVIFAFIASSVFMIVSVQDSLIWFIILFNLISLFFYSLAVYQVKLVVYIFAQGLSLIVSSLVLFVYNIQLVSFYLLNTFLLAAMSSLLFKRYIYSITISRVAILNYLRSYKFFYIAYYKFAFTTVIGVFVALYSRYVFQDYYGILRYESYDLINSTITLLLGVLTQSYISYRVFTRSQHASFLKDFIIYSVILVCLLSVFSIDIVSLYFFNLKLDFVYLSVLFFIEILKFGALKFTVHFIEKDRYDLLGIISLINLVFIIISIYIVRFVLDDFLLAILLVNLASVFFNWLFSYMIFNKLKFFSF